MHEFYDCFRLCINNIYFFLFCILYCFQVCQQSTEHGFTKFYAAACLIPPHSSWAYPPKFYFIMLVAHHAQCSFKYHFQSLTIWALRLVISKRMSVCQSLRVEFSKILKSKF